MKVKLSEIHGTTRVRKTQDTEKQDELTESFSEIGQLVPVMLRPNGDGYQIIFGHRRIDAARQNGEEEIEAIIREMNDKDALIAALAENVVREDMEPIDVGRTLQNLKDATDWTNEELGDKFGRTETWVREHINLLDYEDVVKSNPGSITHHHLVEARAGTERDAKLTKQVLKKAAKEGLSKRETRRVAEEVKRSKDFRGAKGVKEALRTPIEDLGKHWLKKYDEPIVTKVEGEVHFEWLKQAEVLEVEDALKLTSRVIAMMAQKREDVGSAKYILGQWRNFLTNLLNQIDEVERKLS